VTRRVNFQLFLCDGNFRWKRWQQQKTSKLLSL
jgi:hypothetical protein